MPAESVGPVAALPWDALTQPGPIPFPALGQIAAALSAHPASVWPRLRQLYADFWDDGYDSGTFVCLYVPAIVALAAPNLAPDPALELADYWVEELVIAADEEDDTLLPALRATAVALGPVIVPAALKELEAELDAGFFAAAWYALLAALTEVLESAPPFQREPALAFARTVVGRVPPRLIDPDAAMPAALLLVVLRDSESRPLIEAAHRRAQVWRSPVAPLAVVAYADLLERLGKEPDFDLEVAPEPPVRRWLRSLYASLNAFYRHDQADRAAAARESAADPDADLLAAESDGHSEAAAAEDLDDDGDDLDAETLDAEDRAADDIEAAALAAEAAEDAPELDRAAELADRFASSPAAAALPEPRRRVTYIAAHLLEYAWIDLAARPEELDEWGLRRVLRRTLPTCLPADPPTAAALIPTIQALLRWLAAEGLLPQGDALANAIAAWAPEVSARMNDRRRWVPFKTLIMGKVEHDSLDPTDFAAVQRHLDAAAQEREADAAAAGERNARRAATIDALGADADYPAPFDAEPGQAQPTSFVDPDGNQVTAPIHRERTPRNAPCPCGSGKKYKKCCGRG